LAAGAGLLALAALCSILLFIPQMIGWRLVYGQWLLAPIALKRCWADPDFTRILLSADRGYVYWTPLTLILAVFLITMPWRAGRQEAAPISPRWRQQVILLGCVLIAQIYLLASITGDGVFLGSAFGYRHLTECTVLLAPAMAWALQSASPVGRMAWTVLFMGLCFWNELLMALYHREILPRNGGGDLSELISKAGGIARAWPRGFALFLSGPILFAACLKWRWMAENPAWSMPRRVSLAVFRLGAAFRGRRLLRG
jgi:hypothetical protein